MKRRALLLSGSATFALALTGCGGGGSAADATLANAGDDAQALASRRKTTPGTTGSTTTAPSTTTTTTTSPTTSTQAPAQISGTGYPFGSRRVPYAMGILPTHSKSSMDAALTRHYDLWKAHAVVDASSIVAGGKAVKFSQSSFMAVSEGMGYGMLLAVLFAGHDAQAKSLFDGLLAVVRARPAYAISAYDPNGKYLMDWRLYANGASAGEGWNAMDGDEDIAMALLMADRQWGSGGQWNYLQEGKNTIAALKSWNMKPDGTTKGLSTPHVSRTSDYMIGHFRAFQHATGDAFWTRAIDRAYELSDRMQTVYSPGAGLMPDFIVKTDTATPIPSPGMMGDFNMNEDRYWWNACRNPWRFASDYLLSGDTRWKTVTGRMIDFFQAETQRAGGDVTAIGTGYLLNGQQVAGGDSPAYHGPICAGACVDAKYQSFLDALWTWNASHPTPYYYDGEIQLLSLVVASGNWWSPVSFGSAASTATQEPTPATTQPATSTGLLVNGDFASGLTAWANWGNSQVVGGALQVGTGAGGVGQDLHGKMVPGTRYQLTGSARITAAAEGVFVGVSVTDAAGNKLTEQRQLVSSLTDSGVSITFTAPQGAVGGTVFVWKNADGALAVLDSLSLAVA